MRPVRKVVQIVLILIGGVLLLLAVLLFGANLYIQSTFTQTRVQEQISRSLHMPVQLTNASVSPWSGLSMNGITVPQSTEGVAGNFFAAKSLVIHFKFWPILRRQFVVTEVVLSEPTIAWWQDKKGRWQIPKATPTPAATAETAPEPAGTVAPAPAPSAPSASPAESATAASSPKLFKKSAPKFELKLQNIRLATGNFYFYDRKGQPLASFENVNALAPRPSETDVQGEASIATATLPGPVMLEKITSPFVYKPGRIGLPRIQANVADGKLQGFFRSSVDAEGTPFRTMASFSQVDLHRLLGANASVVNLQGRAQGWIDLRGLMAHQESLLGQGQITVEGGQVRNYEFMQMIADALRIEELAVMNLRTAQLDFRVFNNRIWIDSLLLQSQNLHLLVWGSMKIGGQMKLQAQLVINDTISRQLPQFVEQNFTLNSTTGERSVDFNINGKYDKPNTDLLKRLLGGTLEKKANKVLDIFRGMMGGGKKEKPAGP